MSKIDDIKIKVKLYRDRINHLLHRRTEIQVKHQLVQEQVNEHIAYLTELGLDEANIGREVEALANRIKQDISELDTELRQIEERTARLESAKSEDPVEARSTIPKPAIPV